MRRLALLLFCALALGVTWFHANQAPPYRQPQVSFVPLSSTTGLALAPGLTVEGAWQLTAANWLFGGYSALTGDADGLFTAVSDMGARLDFTDPSLGTPQASIGKIFPSLAGAKELRDAEAMTRDRATGRYWIGFEFRNAIMRYDIDMVPQGITAPAVMRGWPENDGPEALVRLADGRFIVLSESGRTPDGRRGAALLFPYDPVEGATPVPFRLALPEGFAPSDMAALPDGRVLVLARRLDFPFPPRFSIRLLLADPSTIRPGEDWPWRVLASLKPPLPVDNYEGLTVVPRQDGTVTLWLISDDNSMATQRTLLLKLHWDPRGSR